MRTRPSGAVEAAGTTPDPGAGRTSQPGTHEFILNSGYDPTLIAQGVGFILTSSPPSGYGYEVSDISGIKCPASISVTAGTSFTCTVSIRQRESTITVDIISNLGRYIVSAPQ